MTPEKKPGLRVQIYQLIKEKRGQKVHNGDIQRFADLQGYLPSNGDRRARDLVERETTKKGVKVPSPYYCPDIKHAKENGSTVYWWEENRIVTPVTSKDASIFKCSQCTKPASTYLEDKPVCQGHSVRELASLGLF